MMLRIIMNPRLKWGFLGMSAKWQNLFETLFGHDQLRGETDNHECTQSFRKRPSSSTKTRTSLPFQNWKSWNSRLQDSLEIRWKFIPFWICKVHFFNQKSRHTWPSETTWCQLHGGHVATGRSESVDGPFVGGVDGFGVFQGRGFLP